MFHVPLLLCRSPVLYQQLGLSKVLRWVKLGLLDANTVITMKVGTIIPHCAVQQTVCQHDKAQHQPAAVLVHHSCLPVPVV